jgi:hypothetical protein
MIQLHAVFGETERQGEIKEIKNPKSVGKKE